MIVLDRNADTFPVGLAGTPFEEVYRALRIVAATVWDVDPLAYRAGMAWGWYALHDPAALTGFRDVVVAALISAVAPMVKETQTDAELAEYLRQWRVYTPTFPKLQALYALFGAVVDIQPISDPESQSVLPVDDTRLAFYIRIESVDFSRPLSLAEAREIAVRATPLGSRPYPYYALETRIPCTVSPAPVGIYIRLENWETARPPAPPQQLGELVFVDASGAVVYSVESLNEMVFAPTGYFTIEDDSDVLFVEKSPYPARGTLAKNYTPNVTIADGSGIDTEIPYYSQKLYIPVVVWHDENWNLGTDYFGWDLSDASGSVYATNNTGSSRIVISVIVAMIDATDAEVVEVKNQSDAHFHAFKWTIGGVPYWYVVDGDEDWTDDLQADGYEEVPSVVLPTVTRQWLYATSSVTTIDLYAGESSGNIYEQVGTSFVAKQVNPSVLQCVFGWRGTSASDYGFGTFEMVTTGTGGYVRAKNITSSRIAGIFYFRYAECSDPTATIVTVYNSSNVAYNAFKFTASGTDYYYVLDGVQADWTDDLAGIGYSLTKTPAVGDIITFGNYPQSTSSPEPIEWIVLDVDTVNQKALLISKYALVSKQYSDVNNPRWWGCTLRAWLNATFLNSAFNADEQSQIVLTNVDTEGVIISNYIFLLSVGEASGYFANDTARICVATQAAINEGIYHTNEGYCPWWLRSTATDSPNGKATFVESDGVIHPEGYYMTDTHFGVRPVLWMQYQ